MHRHEVAYVRNMFINQQWAVAFSVSVSEGGGTRHVPHSLDLWEKWKLEKKEGNIPNINNRNYNY
jgi:hypothetical protein